MANTESETSWTEIFRDLNRRGLSGVRLVVSDSHEGRGLFDFQDIDVGGELVVELHPADLGGEHRLDVQVRHLAEGVDACVTPVLSLEEAARHPHNVARRAFVEVDGVMQNAPAPRFSRSVPAAPRPPRRPGEDAGEVLAELGYDAGEIERLRRSGAISG